MQTKWTEASFSLLNLMVMKRNIIRKGNIAQRESTKGVISFKTLSVMILMIIRDVFIIHPPSNSRELIDISGKHKSKINYQL